MADGERFAVRVDGRDVVTELNGRPIADRGTAEAIALAIALMYGRACSIEARVLAPPARG
jgi:hypothetical protein